VLAFNSLPMPPALWIVWGRLGGNPQARRVPKRLVMMDAVSGEHITSLDLGRKFVALRLPVYSHAPRRPARSGIAGLSGDSLITLESSKEVASVEDLGEGARVNCADGSVYECDALVGADGR
jgi:3-hydroxybenzoate 6-monooxygenase